MNLHGSELFLLETTHQPRNAGRPKPWVAAMFQESWSTDMWWSRLAVGGREDVSPVYLGGVAWMVGHTSTVQPLRSHRTQPGLDPVGRQGGTTKPAGPREVFKDTDRWVPRATGASVERLVEH